MNDNPLKDLEPDSQVPAYLKKVLVSEIDLIRDAMQIVELFTNGLLATAIQCLPDNPDTQNI